MTAIDGCVFGEEEIRKACTIVENTFGSDYFRRGTELLKDSGPSGPGMGRWSGESRASTLLLAWHRSREELTYAALEGYFRPGRYSAIIGILGKSLEMLQDVPEVKTAASGLLDDRTFSRTVFLLSVAAGFSAAGKNLFFPATPEDFFFIGNQYTVTCLQAETPSLPLPPGFFPEYLRPPVKPLKEGITHRKRIVYIDITGRIPSLESTGRQFEESRPALFEGLKPEVIAVILCRTEFYPVTGGVRMKTCSYPVTRNGDAPSGGPGVRG
ncbi:MAG: hypothetical protein K6T65_05230 [Peptococcaceae bacterium]|nr:hypothetical protein [Peptococcaceae bacterium]